MQQTQTYKLNKPETTDPFTPAPLNENADKLDAAIANLNQRVIPLENCRIVLGRYDFQQRVIDLGERPVAVLVVGRSSDGPYMGFVTGDNQSISQNSIDLAIVDNGFQVGGKLYSSNRYYCYAAFLGGWPIRDFLVPET